MISRIVKRTSFGFAVGLALLTGCGPKKPAEPQPQPSASVDSTPPPPKKKLCEAITEGCVADGDTHAKIASSSYVFIPPSGWIYAQESGQTIAKHKTDPLAMAVMSIELPKAAADQGKTLDALFPKLAEAIGATGGMVGKKAYMPVWAKPDDKPKFGQNQFSVWESDAAKLGDKTGSLLTFTTVESGGKTIVGVVFYEANDATMQTIQKSLESIGPGTP